MTITTRNHVLTRDLAWPRRLLRAPRLVMVHYRALRLFTSRARALWVALYLTRVAVWPKEGER